MNPTTHRRVLCQSLAAGAALTLCSSHSIANPALEPAPLLQRGDRLDVAGQETHIVDEAYGSVLCQDVRAAAEGDCPQVVGLAARWTAELLLAAFTDYQASASASPQPEEPPPSEPADAASQGA